MILYQKMKNMTKQELIDKVEQLENDVDYWKKECDDRDETIDDLESQLEEFKDSYSIKDLHNFIFQLKVDNLYTNKIKNFISKYMRFYND